MAHSLILIPRRRTAALTGLATAVLFAAACGHASTTGTPASSPSAAASSSAPSASKPPTVRALGRVSAVNGTAITLASKKGPDDVDITPSTKVTQMTAAQETDIAVGSCVEVRHANRTPPTAKTVIINTDAKAKCTPTSTATEAKGAVTAVTPQAITVSAANGATPVTLPSDPKTRYLKTAEASALVIVPGACLSAAGLQDGNGAVQASSATVRPAINGNCPGA